MKVSFSGIWIATTALALTWAQLLWFLHFNWSSESSYNYGWVVPPMVLLLLLPRLKQYTGSSDTKATGLDWSLVLLGLLGFGLARLLIEVNPFWRLPLWMGASGLILSSWALIKATGGPIAAKRALFPLLFSLTMVPWPGLIEKHIINGLTALVTHVSVESLQLIGYPAERLGNIIQIGAVTVGVEEACSGIKSLQALSMMALFVGAFWGLKLSGRVLLVICAIVFTSLFNLARSLTLSLLVVNGGQELFDKWHDTVGYIALGLGLLALFGIGSQLPSSQETAPAKSKHVKQFPQKLGIACLILATLPLVISEFWYRDTNEGLESKLSWTVDLQAVASPHIEIERLEIHQRVRDILGFDYGHHLAIRSADLEFPAEFWYYGFTGESKSKSLMAYGHSPTICMTASGASIENKLAPLRVDLGALEIPFQHYSFRLPNGRKSQVFWCLWDDLHQGNTESVDGRSRLVQFQSFFERQRSLKRKIALLGIAEDEPEQGRIVATKLIRDLFLLKQGDKTFQYK